MPIDVFDGHHESVCLCVCVCVYCHLEGRSQGYYSTVYTAPDRFHNKERNKMYVVLS